MGEGRRETSSPAICSSVSWSAWKSRKEKVSHRLAYLSLLSPAPACVASPTWQSMYLGKGGHARASTGSSLVIWEAGDPGQPDPGPWSQPQPSCTCAGLRLSAVTAAGSPRG